MKNKRSTLLLAMLGLVVSVTLILSILYNDLVKRQNLTTKQLQEAPPTEAEELK